jgi:hypothetical protein
MLVADRGYDHGEYRRLPRQRGTRPAIAERGQPQSSGLNIFPRVVEDAISWLRGFRRLRIRGERRDDLHEALLGVTTCFITAEPPNAFTRTLTATTVALRCWHGLPP